MRFLRRINLNRYKKGAECAFSILILRAYKPVEVEQSWIQKSHVQPQLWFEMIAQLEESLKQK